MSAFGPKFLLTMGLSATTIAIGAAAPFVGAIAGGIYAASGLLGCIGGFALGVAAGPVPFALTSATLLKENETFPEGFAKAYGKFMKDYVEITRLSAQSLGKLLARVLKKEAPYVPPVTTLTIPDDTYLWRRL